MVKGNIRSKVISSLFIIYAVLLSIGIMEYEHLAESIYQLEKSRTEVVTLSALNVTEVPQKSFEIQHIVEPQPVETSTVSADTNTTKNNYINLSESDIYELATLVYLESGFEPYECQKAVASVVINRMVNNGQTLQEVIYAENQFSPASKIASSQPSDSTLNAVREVVESGPNIPKYVTFFRAGYYHNWSEQIVPYCVYGNTYFSADARLMN